MAIEAAPQAAEPWVGLGKSVGSLGRLREALQCFDRALALDPDNLDAWQYKGITLNGLNEYQQASAANLEWLARWTGKREDGPGAPESVDDESSNEPASHGLGEPGEASDASGESGDAPWRTVPALVEMKTYPRSIRSRFPFPTRVYVGGKAVGSLPPHGEHAAALHRGKHTVTLANERGEVVDEFVESVP